MARDFETNLNISFENSSKKSDALSIKDTSRTQAYIGRLNLGGSEFRGKPRPMPSMKKLESHPSGSVMKVIIICIVL